MKILIPGFKVKTKGINTFQCLTCGCVFEADKDDYFELEMQYNKIFYLCNCPMCGKPAVPVDI